MSIELVSGTARAMVSVDGGIVESYTVAGRDILFPRQEIDGKMRGGSHVCAPYFGPGVPPDQPQHGYGRNVQWMVKDQSTDSVVLAHRQAEGEYAGLEMELRYALESDSLVMALSAHNTADTPLRLTPGFHPYFACPSPISFIEVNDERIEAGALPGTVYLAIPGGRVEVTVADQKYVVASDSLGEFAFWTSHPDIFVCIEPTFAGNSFSDHQQGGDGEYVAPGARVQYSCRIGAK